MTTVGLPDSTVRESRDRVRAAIRNVGLEFPIDRITVNLAPAELRKEGAAFDLPVAVGILSATGLKAVPEPKCRWLVICSPPRRGSRRREGERGWEPNRQRNVITTTSSAIPGLPRSG